MTVRGANPGQGARTGIEERGRGLRSSDSDCGAPRELRSAYYSGRAAVRGGGGGGGF